MMIQKQFIDADQDFSFMIEDQDVEGAVCGDPCMCVAARAIKRTILGKFMSHVIVGKTVAHIFMHDGTSIRFTHKGSLRKAIDHFDRTKGMGANGQGLWELPNGRYTLCVPTATQKKGGRPNRWAKHRANTNGSGRQMIKKVARASTRSIGRAVNVTGL